MHSAPSSGFHQNPQQTPIFNKKGKQKLQQPLLPLQQQKQQFPNATNLQDELNGKKTVPDMQYQQELFGQNNNSSSNVYVLAQQTNASSLSRQSSNSSMRNNEKNIYRRPQAEVVVQQQSQHMVANTQPHNQQSVYQMQAQQARLHSQPNTLQRGKSVQTLGSLLQPQHLIEQQKQSSESQSNFPVVSSMAIDSASVTSQTNEDDWKEELYQKIKTMKDLYLPELKETYKKICILLQEHDSVPQHPRMDAYEKLKVLKNLCKKAHDFVLLPKSQMSQNVQRRLFEFEDFVNKLFRRIRPKRSVSSMQQEQHPARDVQSVQQPFQPQFQSSKMQLNGNQPHLHLQSMSLRHSGIVMEKKRAKGIAHASTVSSQGPTSQQNTMISQQHAEGGNVVGLLLQNPGNTSQTCTSSSLSVGNVPLRKINHLELNCKCLRQQNERKMMKSQPAKRKSQQSQMTKQSGQQKEADQISQLQWNELNNMKVRQGMGFQGGNFLQHHSVENLSVRNPLILRSGPPSPQLHQTLSPQIPQIYSPQIDQKILQTSFAHSTSPLHSPNSRSVGPSPSTFVGPFPIKPDPSKLASVVSSLTNSGNVELKETCSKPALHMSSAISTPGLSPYLLGESDGPDGNHNQVSTTDFCESWVTEEPIQRLVKVVRSMSYNSLSASVCDMESVVRLVDSAAGSKPVHGSRFAIGEDLAGVVKFFVQGEKLDCSSRTMKMRRYIGIVQSNVCASSSKTDSFMQLTDPETCDESTATSPNKRPRGEVKCTLSEEIKEINQRLIDTVVDISEEIVNSTSGTSVTEASEGTIVRCSFNAVTINSDMTSEHSSDLMLLISPLLLLVPRTYPNCSPILLDKLPEEVSLEYEDLSRKARSKLGVTMRNLFHPMSLGEIVKSWDVCAREVITEYAQQSGGGNFSSAYGTWESHLSAA